MTKVEEIAKSVNERWKNMGERSSLLIKYADYDSPKGHMTIVSDTVKHIAKYQISYPNGTTIYIDANSNISNRIDQFNEDNSFVIDKAKINVYDCSNKTSNEILTDIMNFQTTNDVGLIVIDSINTIASLDEISTFTRDMVPEIEKKKNSVIMTMSK